MNFFLSIYSRPSIAFYVFTSQESETFTIWINLHLLICIKFLWQIRHSRLFHVSVSPSVCCRCAEIWYMRVVTYVGRRFGSIKQQKTKNAHTKSLSRWFSWCDSSVTVVSNVVCVRRIALLLSIHSFTIDLNRSEIACSTRFALRCKTFYVVSSWNCFFRKKKRNEFHRNRRMQSELNDESVIRENDGVRKCIWLEFSSEHEDGKQSYSGNC